jgi:hypothetical protein
MPVKYRASVDVVYPKKNLLSATAVRIMRQLVRYVTSELIQLNRNRPPLPVPHRRPRIEGTWHRDIKEGVARSGWGVVRWVVAPNKQTNPKGWKPKEKKFFLKKNKKFF